MPNASFLQWDATGTQALFKSRCPCFFAFGRQKMLITLGMRSWSSSETTTMLDHQVLKWCPCQG